MFNLQNTPIPWGTAPPTSVRLKSEITARCIPKTNARSDVFGGSKAALGKSFNFTRLCINEYHKNGCIIKCWVHPGNAGGDSQGNSKFTGDAATDGFLDASSSALSKKLFEETFKHKTLETR